MKYFLLWVVMAAAIVAFTVRRPCLSDSNESKSDQSKWQIVTDGKGNYTYTDWNGWVNRNETFKTEEEARSSMMQKKQWSDDYDAKMKIKWRALK